MHKKIIPISLAMASPIYSDDKSVDQTINALCMLYPDNSKVHGLVAF